MAITSTQTLLRPAERTFPKLATHPSFPGSVFLVGEPVIGDRRWGPPMPAAPATRPYPQYRWAVSVHGSKGVGEVEQLNEEGLTDWDGEINLRNGDAK